MSQKKITKEWKLLCKYCEIAILGGEASTTMLQSINWATLMKLAQNHRVRPLLFKGITTTNHQSYIPSDLLIPLKKAVFNISIFNLQQANELIKLQRLFQSSAIKVVPYKGSILALEAYSELGLREASDIDLLINPADFKKIQQLLLARNYQAELDVSYDFFKKYNTQYYEYNFDYYKNGQRLFHVEPHWLVGPKRHQIAFNLAEFEHLVAQKNILNTNFFSFTPEGLLLSTFLHHGGQDSWSSLKQIADLVAILNKFSDEIEWKSFFKLLDDWKITNLFLLGVGIAIRLFDINLNNHIAQQLNVSKITKLVNVKILQLVSSNKKKKATNAIFQHLWFNVRLRKYWSTKVKIIYYHFIQMLRPNIIDVKGKKLEEINMFWLTLKKPFRLINQFTKE